MPPTKKVPSRPAQKTAAKKAVAKKAVAKKSAAKRRPETSSAARSRKKAPASPRPARKKAAKAPPRRRRQDRTPSELHRRAVGAVKGLFGLSALDAARWIWGALPRTSSKLEFVDAVWVQQPPKGPAYVVPPPRPDEERPPTPEQLLADLLKSAIEQEAKASKGKVKVEPIEFDFDEAMRQTLAEGGAEVELATRVRAGKGKTSDLLFGVLLPDEHEDGKETPRRVMRVTSWHLIASEQLFGLRRGRIAPFLTVPLYLWPGTGLEDPEEICSVFTGELKLPGLLGDLLALQDPKERERERAERRKMNLERLERQRRLDAERRTAAARRAVLMGDAGIGEEKLAALVPPIDVENDRITMIQDYDILRLWERPFEALLESLPPALIGLSLFGYRPREMSAETALERCAFTLRRALRDASAADAERAAVGLFVVGSVFVEPEEAKRLLERMKLL